jgi:hypothetical protein
MWVLLQVNPTSTNALLDKWGLSEKALKKA